MFGVSTWTERALVTRSGEAGSGLPVLGPQLYDAYAGPLAWRFVAPRCQTAPHPLWRWPRVACLLSTIGCLATVTVISSSVAAASPSGTASCSVRMCKSLPARVISLLPLSIPAMLTPLDSIESCIRESRKNCKFL